MCLNLNNEIIPIIKIRDKNPDVDLLNKILIIKTTKIKKKIFLSKKLFKKIKIIIGIKYIFIKEGSPIKKDTLIWSEIFLLVPYL